MKRFGQFALTAGALSLAVAVACGDDDDTPPPPPNNNTAANNNTATNNNTAMNNNMAMNNDGPMVTLTFTIDDSANNTYGPEGAQPIWNDFDNNGSVELTNDGTGVWSASVMQPIPATDQTYNYGANVEFSDGNDWIWAYDSRHVGSYTVPASATPGSTITVPGLTIPAFGTWNMRATVDTSTLATVSGNTFDPSLGVGIKTNRNAFVAVILSDDGTNGDVTANDGIYTFDMNAQAEAATMGSSMSSVGLLAPGERVEFTWVFGATEYKGNNGGLRQAVEVELCNTATDGDGCVATSTSWVPANVVRLRSDRNTGVIATSSVSQYDLRVLVDSSALDTAAIENGVTFSQTSTVYFTNSWIVKQEDTGSGTFEAYEMFDNGRNGDETAGDGIYTFLLSEWVGGEWVSNSIIPSPSDLRNSTLLQPGPDPLGRETFDGNESRFKVRIDDNGFYGSLDGVTVQYKRPGESTWNDIEEFPTVGFGDFRLIIPND